MLSHLFYKYLMRPVYLLLFKRFGKGSTLRKPLRLRGTRRVTIGRNVLIKEYGWLEARPVEKTAPCRITIGDHTVISYFSHIYATQEISIGNNVLISRNVYIADNMHHYEACGEPVLGQGIKQLAPVTIGEGSWLGTNAVVMGASIGKYCVIGAGAVVIRDIPDYCMAAGNPALVRKIFDPQSGLWHPVTTE